MYKRHIRDKSISRNMAEFWCELSLMMMMVNDDSDDDNDDYNDDGGYI